MGTKFYKHPQYGMVWGESLPTPVGRLCWLYLTKPKDAPPPQDGQPQGQPRYETTLLVEKVGNEKFIEAVKTMTDEMLPLFNKGRSAELSGCKLFGKYGDGDEADLEKYPYYKGCWVLVARNAKIPKVVGKDRKPIDAKELTGGMKGKLVITPLITAHGISYKLEAVQLIQDDGTKFAGAVRDATELLDACEDEALTVAPETVAVVELVTPAVVKTGKEAALDLL